MNKNKPVPAISDLHELLAHLKREGWTPVDDEGDLETLDGTWLCELQAADTPRVRAWVEFDIDGHSDTLVWWTLFVQGGGSK